MFSFLCDSVWGFAMLVRWKDRRTNTKKDKQLLMKYENTYLCTHARTRTHTHTHTHTRFDEYAEFAYTNKHTHTHTQRQTERERERERERAQTSQ